MNKKPVIRPAELLLMSVGNALIFPYTFMPIITSPPANQDVWAVLLLSTVYLPVLNFPILFLVNKFRGMSVNEVAETILGAFFGKIAALAFALFFIFCSMACLLITAVFISLYIFAQTPTWAVLLYMLVPVAYASYKGAGVIGRLAFFIVPFIIVTIIVFLLLGLKLMDFNVLLPVFSDSTFLELNKGAFLTAARYSEILVFFVFSHWLKKESSVNRIYTAAVALFSACFLLILLPTLTVLGVELCKHAWNPYFIYTSQVEGYDFIERVQSINTLAWFPATLLKLIVYNFMGCFTLSGIFKTKSHRGFVIPVSVFAFFVCLIPFLNKASTVQLLISDRVFPFIVLPATLVVPLVLVVVYFFRRKKICAVLHSPDAPK